MQTNTSTATTEWGDESGPSVFLDVDGVILESRPVPRGTRLLLRPGAVDGLRRLTQIAGRVILLVDPTGRVSGSLRDDTARVETIGAHLDTLDLDVIACPHRTPECGCRKPSPGLIELARAQLGIPSRAGWHIGGDQAGVQAGRSAGLRTIRVGPPAEDHLSSVHRADYEARDLLDAANWVLVESLSAP